MVIFPLAAERCRSMEVFLGMSLMPECLLQLDLSVISSLGGAELSFLDVGFLLHLVQISHKICTKPTYGFQPLSYRN